MPIVRIDMIEGRTTEQKEAMVEAITDVIVKIAKVSREHVWVIIEDVKKDNWSVGGKLFSKMP
jgi:4-oxalocrotonate tautomerase